MQEPQVDIIIPVYNKTELTRNCLDSIKNRSDLAYRLYIIDNSSDEETRKFLEGLRDEGRGKKEDCGVVLIRNEENLGWVKAVNQGMRISKSRYVCIMNNDTIVHTDGWLSKMTSVLSLHKDIGLANPSFDMKKNLVSNRAFIEIDFCRGYCVLLKREVVNMIGYLDEDYGLGYYDDDDYSVRSIRAGFRCVRVNGVYVEHLRDTTFRELFREDKRLAMHEKNKALFYSKWGRRLKIAFLFTGNHENKVLSEMLFFTARRQHVISVWNAGTPVSIEHINIREVAVPGFFGRIFFTARAFMDSLKSAGKRFDIIFTDDKRISGVLSGVRGGVIFADPEKEAREISQAIELAAKA